MANKTIHGCYEDSGDRKILFEGEACDGGDYEGCYDDDASAGQVIPVVIQEANCDDTYYACYNKISGQYDLEIPDNCCSTTTTTPEPGAPCEDCGDSQPKYFTCRVQGLATTSCHGTNPPIKHQSCSNYINGVTYILQQDPIEPCEWTRVDSGVGGGWREYIEQDCTGDSEYHDHTELRFRLWRDLPGGFSLDINWTYGEGYVFAASEEVETCMEAHTFTNIRSDTGGCCCYGGTAYVSPGN